MPNMNQRGRYIPTWVPQPLREKLVDQKNLIKPKNGNEYTISVIKADVGSYTGHVMPHPKLLEQAEYLLSEAIKKGKLIDGIVSRVGDDIHLLMTHNEGVRSEKIHGLAWDIFNQLADIAKELHLYGAGQDLLKSEFSGNLQGMGPGVCEMEITERKTEPIIFFAADKTSPYTWNRPLFEMFTDHKITIGLVVDEKMQDGFIFEVKELKTGFNAFFHSPKDNIELLAYAGSQANAIERVWKAKDKTVAAVTSTSRLSFIAGKYVGKDDPVMLVRVQSGLPAVGEALNPFIFPSLVPGGMRGSCWRPLMPCSVFDCDPTFNDGPPRVIALGFQMKEGQFSDPVDHLGDISFDNARKTALEIATYMQSHGAFEPGRLSDEDLEYGGIPKVRQKVVNRFTDITQAEKNQEKIFQLLNEKLKSKALVI